jgi:acyl-CoA thioester hydrolase
MTELIEDIKDRFLKFKDTTRVKIRFNDTDAMGTIHFKNYMVYFDDGFVSLMNNIAHPRRIEDTLKEGIACGVKHVDIFYEGNANYGDYIVVESQIMDISNKSITFNHEIYKEQDKTLLAKVECERYFIDLVSDEILDATEFLLNYTKLDDPP